MKILHVFDHSLPLHSGYAFRSESILLAQRKRGLETVHITSPKQGPVAQLKERHGELEFHRSHKEGVAGGGPAAQLACVRHLRAALKPLIAAEKPDLIHAHSPSLNGLAALNLGIPLVYEVRATWEDAAVTSGTTTEGSLRYRLTRALESFVFKRVDRPIVICDGLRDDFAARHLSDTPITVIGNAINPETYTRPDPEACAELRRKHGLEGATVIGFFGSFYRYEGLGLLIDAMRDLVSQFPDVHCILAGGGEVEEELRQQVTRLKLQEHVYFVGRVPHDKISNYYGLADLMVFPRLKSRLTDIVTPLKPLESMFFDCVVVASDVGGHRELVSHEKTGLLFEAGSVSALREACERALQQRGEWDRWLANGRSFVTQDRTWDAMAARTETLYRELLSSRG